MRERNGMSGRSRTPFERASSRLDVAATVAALRADDDEANAFKNRDAPAAAGPTARDPGSGSDSGRRLRLNWQPG